MESRVNRFRVFGGSNARAYWCRRHRGRSFFLSGDIGSAKQHLSKCCLSIQKFSELRKFLSGKSVFASRGRVRSLGDKGEVRIAESILPRHFSSPGSNVNRVANGCFQCFIDVSLNQLIGNASCQSSIEGFRNTAKGANQESAESDRTWEFSFGAQNPILAALATSLSESRSIPFRIARTLWKS